MVESSQPIPDCGDPWRRRMARTAERLRQLDGRRFASQIAKIEECLQRDATWSLEAALTSGDRWPARSGSPSECRSTAAGDRIQKLPGHLSGVPVLAVHKLVEPAHGGRVELAG